MPFAFDCPPLRQRLAPQRRKLLLPPDDLDESALFQAIIRERRPGFRSGASFNQDEKRQERSGIHPAMNDSCR